MQHHDGLELRRKWGDKPCKHKSLEAEWFESTPTGDYLCKDCGKVFAAWETDGLRSQLDEDE